MLPKGAKIVLEAKKELLEIVSVSPFKAKIVLGAKNKILEIESS